MLRDKMMQDSKLAGYAAKTQKTYLECIGLVAQFCSEPGQADQEQVRSWLAKLQQSNVGPQRLRQHFAALIRRLRSTSRRTPQLLHRTPPGAPVPACSREARPPAHPLPTSTATNDA